MVSGVPRVTIVGPKKRKEPKALNAEPQRKDLRKTALRSAASGNNKRPRQFPVGAFCFESDEEPQV